tara:strand:- start:7672 stop:8508 length:837 start_codon:yes stop_codon:yes gene_type:complete
MSADLIWAEPWIRFGTFAAVFALMAVSEILHPVCHLPPRLKRWRTNLGMTLAATLLLRVTLPVAAIGTAIWAQETNIGLFNYFDVPIALSLPLSILVLDLLIYGQHVLFHRVGFLWRLHKVHHADPALDVTTALRFHPFEILLSMIIKIFAVTAMGVPPVAVLAFEIILNASAMFNHGNLQLGATMSQWLVRFIVTPDMHRVHHSVEPDAQNRNFGFNLSLWDRIFGTYRRMDGQALAAIRIGLNEHDDVKPTQFIWSLILPFLTTSSQHEPSGVSKP